MQILVEKRMETKIIPCSFYRPTVLVMLLALLSCRGSNTNTVGTVSESPLWLFHKVEGCCLVFKDHRRINTRLFEVRYIETLNNNDAPYFVLSGRSCEHCDENVSVFILSPNDTLKTVSEYPKYSFPRKVYDYETHALVFESKLYLCNTNEKHSNSLVWLQKELNSRNRFDSSLFIVDVLNGVLRERKISSQTKGYFENAELLKYSKEIEGIEVTSDP